MIITKYNTGKKQTHRIALIVLFFAFSWDLSFSSTLDTLYYVNPEPSVPDTIYVIESSSESYYSPNTNGEKLNLILHFHPTSLLYGLEKKGLIGILSIENEFAQRFSFIYKPQIIYHDLEAVNSNYYFNSYDYDYEIMLKQTLVKMGFGIRRYNRRVGHNGFFFQANGMIGLGQVKSLSSENKKMELSYATGAISNSFGRSWKTNGYSCFFDIGLGLKLSSEEIENNSPFEAVFLIENENGFYLEMNFGIGFYLD